MHDIHRNACLAYLFIPCNIPVAGADRDKDISKHKPRPAKSWVVRLISKRQQCRAEAKDPILVIIPPVAPPLNETPDTHAVSGSLNITSLEAHALLASQSIFFFFYGGCVLIGKSTKSWQLVCRGAILSWWLICLTAMTGPQPTAGIPLWFSASGAVPCGGFPSLINITRIIHWHHCFSHLGPGRVLTITLHLQFN